MTTTTVSFEVGRTYWTRSACDYNCIFTITVAKRTAKRLTTTEGKTLGISVATSDGAEYVRPLGSYSMSPVIYADHLGNGPTEDR